jgi:hypothetical protein
MTTIPERAALCEAPTPPDSPVLGERVCIREQGHLYVHRDRYGHTWSSDQDTNQAAQVVTPREVPRELRCAEVTAATPDEIAQPCRDTLGHDGPHHTAGGHVWLSEPVLENDQCGAPTPVAWVTTSKAGFCVLPRGHSEAAHKQQQAWRWISNTPLTPVEAPDPHPAGPPQQISTIGAMRLIEEARRSLHDTQMQIETERIRQSAEVEYLRRKMDADGQRILKLSEENRRLRRLTGETRAY